MLEPLFEADEAAKISRTRGEGEKGLYIFLDRTDEHCGFTFRRDTDGLCSRHRFPLCSNQRCPLSLCFKKKNKQQTAGAE